MINQKDIVAALTADYLNIYLIEPQTDTGSIIKLDGYVIDGIKDAPDFFQYSKFLTTYANSRVCDEDRSAFIHMLSPEELNSSFADGRERLELRYRVNANGKISHFTALYIRVSQAGEALQLIAGFRNVDEIISMESQIRDEGLRSAYAAISDMYLAMHRVDLKAGTYVSVKTTDAILRFSLPDSDMFDENMRSIIRGLAKEESYIPALEFLDLSTLEERMRGKKHISMNFEGKVAGSCRLHFMKEDEDDSGALWHVIFTVEVVDEDRYRSAFDVLSRGFQDVFWIDLKSARVKLLKLGAYVSEGLEGYRDTLYDYQRQIERYISDWVHPQDKQMLRDTLSIDNIRTVLKAQDGMTGNYRVLVDGEMHNYQYSYSLAESTQYVVCGFQNIDAIIAEHVEHEKKDREREEAYQHELEKSHAALEEMRDIFASSKMGTWHITLIDGKEPTMEGDALMLGLLGVSGQSLSPEELYDAWFSRIEPDSVASVLESVSKMEQGNRDENTYLWNHPTLGTRYVRCGGTATAVPGGYVLRGYHYDVHDIVTAQKEQERKLSESLTKEHQHSEVISALATIYTTIFRAEVDTHEYEVINSVDLMGSVAGVGGNFDDVKEGILSAFMAPEYRDEMRRFIDLDTIAERLKDVNTIATEYKNPVGRWFQARFIVKNRDENGRAISVLYVARDFTDEKEHELEQQEQLTFALAAAQQASKAKSTFLNSMSHDIRTPMNAIIGFTALAQTHIDNHAQVQDYLGKISTSSTHLLSLINDILDMSRIESGTVKLDEKPVHIPELLHDLRTMIQGLINAKNQNLYIDTQDVLHEDVITDKLRLNQVLINIVGNAIKYTQPGGDVIIRLCEKPCATNHYTTYEFSVKDNGVGMSREFIGHIFDTFSREYSSTISGVQGTGLGMAITKNIVDMMGGHIDVESEEGKGSKFTVTLNLRLANEPVKYAAIPELLGARALVVDDDINTCRSVCSMLRSIEMRPDWTVSGKEAVLRAQDAAELEDEYKVYIIDYLMPDINGIEVVRRIRRVIGDNVPIIVLTAYNWEDFEEEARAAGVTAFVAKPLFMSELRAVLTAPAVRENTAAGTAETTHRSYTGKHVLLVEDNELNREIATALLEETGMTIECASDGIEAVEAVNNAPADKYDLILMDIQMPRMDGYTATREIRTLSDNKKANIPIVAMTANAFEEDKHKALASGMNGHIVKPVSMDAIVKTLDAVFAEK